MKNSVRRIFVEKREGMNIEALGVLADLRENLGVTALEGVRLLNRYDVQGLEDQEYEDAIVRVFSEPNQDVTYKEEFTVGEDEVMFSVEYLPGQYDQRADSAAQCIQIFTAGERPLVTNARVYVLKGKISEDDLAKIKNYCINPVESREASPEKPATLEMETEIPADVAVMTGFTALNDEEIANLKKEMGLAMSAKDLAFCRDYFRDTEKRDPHLTEIKVIDTYWSDHCRHTTFLTRLNDVTFEDCEECKVIKDTYMDYLEVRKELGRTKPVSLMDLGTIAAKYLSKQGLLTALDKSEEINACSIRVKADIDGKEEDYLIMFKNETHNHPTEIEPFGGAATCLGGAIRDPLSGRSYVYQAMRVTGAGDPTVPVSKTMKGKLSQRKITTTAAAGYSSYGNQIGLATGQVQELYHPGYVAKRMEIGGVIAAAPAENVVREAPVAGDIIILLGGRTGRDGIGGATGSSKEHDEKSVTTCGSEVQKGNAPTERKIQRLFRKKEVSTLIKRCNDFGAGGVCVAIGELSPGLVIELDKVPVKYKGIDGTELAISESQERMAVVIKAEDEDKFIAYADEENLEAIKVATVTEEERLVMHWRGNTIVDVSRAFLDTNGVPQDADAHVVAPNTDIRELSVECEDFKNLSLEEKFNTVLSDLNSCCQKGLSERFDSTIGANTVLMPWGGLHQLTRQEGMAAKIPVEHGDTTTGTLMTYGFDPYLSEKSQFHGALYAVVESVARIVAMGGNHKDIYLSFQEYFERLGEDKNRWGKPLASLLGAFLAQKNLGVAAIGGKDSMSGTFINIHVPPTLVSFAVAPVDVRKVVSSEFKQAGNRVIYYSLPHDENELPDFDSLHKNYSKIHELINDGKVVSASSVKIGGLCETISNMCFGNKLGFLFNFALEEGDLFRKSYGSMVLELSDDCEDEDLEGLDYTDLGVVSESFEMSFEDEVLDGEKLLKVWMDKLSGIFPHTAKKNDQPELKDSTYEIPKADKKRASISIAKPRVFIPVFPGTNCEYETAKAFENAGAKPEIFVFKNLNAKHIEESVKYMAEKINNSQIIMIPGGFSGGDEPDGSGKFIATAFRNPVIKDAVMDMLKNRDGLMLGICNGFQALIKLGLVPYGEIRDTEETAPTLTFNTIGRHISRMVYTRVNSTLSPWLWNTEAGEQFTVPVSHGEGRFVVTPEEYERLAANHQIATQYCNPDSLASTDPVWSPNGSYCAIEGITSPDGHVLGKMAHSERIGTNVGKNVPGNKDQQLFKSGVEYFK
ncbi:MAG: phosphoribosylformylglycinamidine synthase [Ruminococcaceae bacterium]|nr:phosphoribosylformylglycinamidine synthase [Oscillospiraceae bacterium]